MELACYYYSRTKTVNYSYNSSSLLLGFVYVKKKKYRICKFCLLQELKQRRFFFIKQTQASYKTTELMNVYLAY